MVATKITKVNGRRVQLSKYNFEVIPNNLLKKLRELWHLFFNMIIFKIIMVDPNNWVTRKEITRVKFYQVKNPRTTLCDGKSNLQEIYTFLPRQSIRNIGNTYSKFILIHMGYSVLLYWNKYDHVTNNTWSPIEKKMSAVY